MLSMKICIDGRIVFDRRSWNLNLHMINKFVPDQKVEAKPWEHWQEYMEHVMNVEQAIHYVHMR